MTGSADPQASRLEQLPGNVARVDPADRFPFGVDRFGKFERLGHRLLEHQMQKLSDELLRRVIVVVEGDLAAAGLGVNIVHRMVPP